MEWIEGVKEIDLSQVVDESILGDEGGTLLGLHTQQQVGMLDKELAALLEIVVVIGELDGLGPAQQRLVGI